jgi:hypothetical protein
MGDVRINGEENNRNVQRGVGIQTKCGSYYGREGTTDVLQ